MSYENKAGRLDLEYGAPVAGGITMVGGRPTEIKRLPKSEPASVTAGDELVGIATRYGIPHRGKNGRLEIFVQGCFARTLASKSAVRLLYGHDEVALVATRADALEIEGDDRDLRIRCAVPDSPYGRKLRQAVTSGEAAECSVGYLIHHGFEREVSGEKAFFITDAELLEVSVVGKGAVPGTHAEIRSNGDDQLITSLQQLNDVLDKKARALRLLLDSL